jgi:Tfp pilus assembly protein PilO
MRDFQFTKKFIIACLTILVLADVALLFFNSRMSMPQQDRQQTLAVLNREVALRKADADRASEIREKRSAILKKFDDFESTMLPASKGYSVTLQEMDQYARDTHLVVDNVKFREKEVEGRGLLELTLESRVTGDYNGIVRFLNHLQRSKNVYIVDGLSVDTENTAQGGPAGNLRVTLHLRTFFRKV